MKISKEEQIKELESQIGWMEEDLGRIKEFKRGVGYGN